MPDATLGSRLRRVREARGISRTEAATALGCQRSNVSHQESDRTQPSVGQLRIYSRLYGVTVDELITLDAPLDGIPEVENAPPLAAEEVEVLRERASEAGVDLPPPVPLAERPTRDMTREQIEKKNGEAA